jgi:hypothetical protein
VIRFALHHALHGPKLLSSTVQLLLGFVIVFSPFDDPLPGSKC